MKMIKIDIKVICIIFLIILILSLATYMRIQKNTYKNLCKDEGGILIFEDDKLYCIDIDNMDINTTPVIFICKDFLKLDCTMKHINLY